MEARIEFRVLHHYLETLQKVTEGFFREQDETFPNPPSAPRARPQRYRSSS